MDKLILKKPARRWVDGTPIGNGLTGAMIYGGKRKETIALNDAKFWSGYPKDYDSDISYKNIDAVRKLIFDGKYKEAEAMTEKTLCGDYSESFLPLGNIALKFAGIGSGSYQRELDLSSAILTINSGSITRECFCSYPDKVLCYKISGEKAFSLTISASSPIVSETYIKGGRLYVSGNAPDKDLPPYVFSKKPIDYSEGKGMAFAFAVEVKTDGQKSVSGNTIKIVGAKNVTLFISTATGFISYDQFPSTNREKTATKCGEVLDKDLDYDIIKARHIKDYSDLYSRQTLSLGEETSMPASELQKLAKRGKTQKPLCELLYNFGKYLMISASRPGGEATNLQGIWNNIVRPPWSSNYTVNINTEMNYWATEQVGLSECSEPFIDFVYDLIVRGRKTAKVNYGTRGSCACHNADIWRHTAPVKGTPSYMFAPLCGVWLTNEAYEHYRYGHLEHKRDKIKFIVEECAKFALDFLVEHNGELVTCPSTSPEHRFYADGGLCSVGYASAFDLGVIRQAFRNAREISSDEALKEEIALALSKLRAFTFGKDGINEWQEDFVTEDKGHRHFSPLYALYPGRVVDYYKDKEVVEGIGRLYESRLDNAKLYHGWSGAWAICLAGRLRNAKRAETVIRNMTAHSIFPNLLDMHPPRIFQIDGNYGYVAGVNELLATVDDGVLELLPALPEMWDRGSVKGLRMPGGAIVDFSWEDGKVSAVSVSGGSLKLRPVHLKDNVKVSGIELSEA